MNSAPAFSRSLGPLLTASSRSDAHRVAASARSATESTEPRTASLADVMASVARSATWSVAARAWSAILETLGLDSGSTIVFLSGREGQSNPAINRVKIVGKSEIPRAPRYRRRGRDAHPPRQTLIRPVPSTLHREHRPSSKPNRRLAQKHRRTGFACPRQYSLRRLQTTEYDSQHPCRIQTSDPCCKSC